MLEFFVFNILVSNTEHYDVGSVVPAMSGIIDKEGLKFVVL